MNKGKLIVLVGISGAGKSTFAHQEWLKDPLQTAVINRDKIRELLFGYTEETIKDYYSLPDLGKLEKQVTLYEDTLIHEGLNLGKTVVVDATHLEKRYLDRFKFWNVPIEYKYFDVSVVTAIIRDSYRVRTVGEDIIKKQYDKYLNLQRDGVPLTYEPVELKQNLTLTPCIIFDIDGTIAEKGDRSAFDWKRVGEDSMIGNVAVLMDWLDDLKYIYRPRIIVCTGRDAVCEKETREWLEKSGLNYDEIHFRPEGDQRADWIVKEEMWRKLANDYYITALVDDRNQVVRRARSLGLTVLQATYGNF
jgi:predicted kinase